MEKIRGKHRSDKNKTTIRLLSLVYLGLSFRTLVFVQKQSISNSADWRFRIGGNTQFLFEMSSMWESSAVQSCEGIRT